MTKSFPQTSVYLPLPFLASHSFFCLIVQLSDSLDQTRVWSHALRYFIPMMLPENATDTGGECGRDGINYNQLDFTYNRKFDLASEPSNSPILLTREQGPSERQWLARAQHVRLEPWLLVSHLVIFSVLTHLQFLCSMPGRKAESWLERERSEFVENHLGLLLIPSPPRLPTSSCSLPTAPFKSSLYRPMTWPDCILQPWHLDL